MNNPGVHAGTTDANLIWCFNTPCLSRTPVDKIMWKEIE